VAATRDRIPAGRRCTWWSWRRSGGTCPRNRNYWVTATTVSRTTKGGQNPSDSPGGGVQHALGLAGGARGVQDEERVLAVHGLRTQNSFIHNGAGTERHLTGTVRAGRCHELVHPHVSACLHAGRGCWLRRVRGRRGQQAGAVGGPVAEGEHRVHLRQQRHGLVRDVLPSQTR